MDGAKLFIYKRAEDLAITGLLDLEEAPPSDLSENINLNEFLEVQTALSYSTTWGSILLVYYGIEVPVYIARLPPVQYFYVNTGCGEAQGRTRVKDSVLLKFWAYLTLNKLDRAFQAIGSPCLRLDYPKDTCISYAVQPGCEASIKAKPSPAGLIDESKLPPYLKGKVS
ncbi:MAG: hypothetical protein GSR82_03575 [Desulfurococcales archaeon]|nr:hypothetical protein [Desulfurococcales archaeon]